LPIADRIKALEDYLALGAIDDPEVHGELQRQLILLQQTQAAPGHACRMTSKVSATEINLKQLLIDSNHLRGYGLDVNINGVLAHLMLDTGAGGILIDRKIAEKANVAQIVHTDVHGIGDRGPAGGYIGAAGSIQIGDLEFTDCRVEVMESRSVGGGDGLIGGDVFAHFLVDIDSPHGKFRLSELPPRPDEPAAQAALEAGGSPELNFHDRYIAPEMKTYSRIFRFGHLLLIPTALNDSLRSFSS